MNPSKIMEVLSALGADRLQSPPTTELLQRIEQLFVRFPDSAPALIAEVLRAERRAHDEKQRGDANEQACRTAMEAAESVNELMQDMVNGATEFFHLLRVRYTDDGPRAVCPTGSHLRELAIHPEVDVEELEQLEPWERVGVHENVVVGTWRDDLALFADAHGEIATFKSYVDRSAHLVEVARHGHEDAIVVLNRSLWDHEMTPQTRLILQRDNPHQAIAIAANVQTRSKFEVPIENINMRLDDLAGIEDIAVPLIDDVLLQIRDTDVRDRFGLRPIRGVLLHSSKPGMGKSKFTSGFARWLYDHSDVFGYDVVLYEIKPGETKSMWHGQDAQIVRDLWSAVRARQAQPRTRPLIQILVFDEIDSFGKRGEANEMVTSAAQHDGLQATLAEMDGIARGDNYDDPPSHVLCFGMTNRLDKISSALKRPGRFGDLVLAMPAVTIESAENVMAIYARGSELPWHLDGETEVGVDEEIIRSNFLRPALSRVFDAVVIHYKTDTQRSIEVTAGQIMANVHLMDAINAAKKRAAVRCRRRSGIAAVTFDDVVDCLLDSALTVAQQMEADPHMLIRHLNVKVPVTRVDAVAKRELADHRFLRV
jgi:SpoVK/Ycf46/Vps4 family AAA+-type ATPase